MSMRLQRYLRVFWILGGLATVALLWQNCSRVALQVSPTNMLSLSPTLNLKGAVCPQYVSSASAPTSFLFVVDMSLSNIGASLDQNGFYYWDATKATDQNGERFQAIQYFLNNCANNDARFAVIGFSSSVGSVTGSLMSASWNNNCNSITFGSAPQATSVLNGLMAEQTAEFNWYNTHTLASNNYFTETAFPPIMLSTYYTTALNCADQIVNTDLLSSSSIGTQQYEVIFITDGAPNDPQCELAGMSDAQKQACFVNGVNLPISDMRQSALAMAKDLRLSTVFYGNASDAPTTGAPAVLSQMSTDGGTAAPMQLASFQNQQGALCSLVASELSVAFAPDTFFAVNLTTLNQGDKQKADSDMDGIPDDEEVALGYDPLNPRSAVSGVLDGICQKLGGISQCQQLRSQLQCDPTVYSNYLTDCDIKILKLDATQNPTAGLDTDGDGLLDFIEVIKGTNPNLKDALLDPDGDGMTNQQEIIQGSDPFTADASFNPALMNLLSVNFNPTSSACVNGGWDISVSQTSVSQTQAVQTFPTTVQELNHRATDQLLWVGYRMVPRNSSNSKITYYGKIVNIKLTDSGLGQTATPNFIDSTLFNSLGQVLP
jgi:hypothetical protein